MSALFELIESLPPDQRSIAYDELARVALRGYPVATRDVTFLGHNSGAAFRVETRSAGHLLLKVHAPRGEGESPEEAAIAAGLRWLASMAELGDLCVQTPVPDSAGAILSTVTFRGMALRCSLQHWIDGRQVDRLTTDQARAVGALLGRWHGFSAMRGGTLSGHAMRYDGEHLGEALRRLSVPAADGLIGEDGWRAVEEATALACELLDSQRRGPDAFGVIHGDVNPDNVVLADDGTVHLIDVAQLAVAPYLWDVGVALYQYSYQDPAVRRALVQGYRESRPGAVAPPFILDSFVCMAALSNLAFQCTIPEQRVSALFRTNVERFATEYCRKLLRGRPFALE